MIVNLIIWLLTTYYAPMLANNSIAQDNFSPAKNLTARLWQRVDWSGENIYPEIQRPLLMQLHLAMAAKSPVGN